MRADLAIIHDWIKPGSRVLDLGCGDGTLLRELANQRQVSGYGLEIDPDKIIACLENGVSVIHADLEAGLADFSDATFDYVIMTQTLQTVLRTERLLEEMLRVGREGIVTFPNFGFWKCRVQLLLQGVMPVHGTLPHPWYATPNVHLFTLRDFESLCQGKGIQTRHRAVVNQHHRLGVGSHLWPNLLGELALYRLGRD